MKATNKEQKLFHTQ